MKNNITEYYKQHNWQFDYLYSVVDDELSLDRFDVRDELSYVFEIVV